jgi:hypothetical protein
MEESRDTIALRLLRALAAAGTATVLALIMTWPLATGYGRLGRTLPGDGPYAIWNVTWVARTLVTEPLQLFDANIFYPHRWALAFSELNIVAGVVGIPAWLATHNPYATHNTALIFGFATSALAAWLLARRLTGSSSAALFAGAAYGFCPYFFAHTSHIQLLMGGGIPLSFLMLHRLADAPSIRRGIELGLALGLQALACAYYGILAGLMIGYGAIFLSVSRRLWTRTYWTAIAAGALVSAACVVPFFIPFLEIQEGGFHRTLDESRRYSANLATYMASSAHAHRWLLELSARFGRWNEVLFPGGLAIILGTAGLVLSIARPSVVPAGGAASSLRETALLYGSLGALTFWATLGPAGGLYSLLFHTLPLMSFLRAPARFGVFIPLMLGILGSLAIVRLQPRRRTVAGVALAGLALLELNTTPFGWNRAPVVPSAYRMLAQLPKAPVAEFPFYGERIAFPLHTQYMLFSTFHWQPLLNGYSDHIPADFRQAAAVLDSFPSVDVFNVMRKQRVRYITVNWNMFGPRAAEIRVRLEPFAPNLRELAGDDLMTLYEIVSFP